MPREPKPYPYRGWYVTDAGGTPHHRLCPVARGLVEAKRQLRNWLTRLDEQRQTKPPPGPGIRPDPPEGKKVGDAHDEFLDFKKSEQVKGDEGLTYQHYVARLKPFYEQFAGRDLADLSDRDGTAYRNWLKEEKEWKKGKKTVRGVGPTSVNHFLRAAKTFLNWCAKPSRRWVPFNPWQDLTYEREYGRERTLTDEEFGSLLRHCATCRYRDREGHSPAGCSFCRDDADFRDALLVLRHTTMRPSELRLLEWDEVDLARHRINIRPRRVKTRKTRVLTLLPQVEEVLARRLVDAVEKGYPQGLVFPVPRGHTKGEGRKRASFSQRFRRLRDRCVSLGEIREEKKGERLVLYTTRHTRITEMFVEGNEQHVVMRESGHVVPATTERYKHLADDYVNDRVRRNAAGGRSLSDVGTSG